MCYSARSFSKDDLNCACVKFSDNLFGKIRCGNDKNQWFYWRFNYSSSCCMKWSSKINWQVVTAPLSKSDLRLYIIDKVRKLKVVREGNSLFPCKKMTAMAQRGQRVSFSCWLILHFEGSNVLRGEVLSPLISCNGEMTKSSLLIGEMG